MKGVHDRTAAILEPGEEAAAWLDPSTRLDQTTAALHPAPDGILQWHAVSTRVNSPRNEGPNLGDDDMCFKD